MGKYILKRVLLMIPVLLGVSIFIFTLLYFVPGDPADIILGSNVPEYTKEALRVELGLNDSYIVQLGRFLRDTFLRFDFGESYLTGQPVIDELLYRIPYSVITSWPGLFLALLIGVPQGITAAVHQNSWRDNITMFFSIFAVSMPGFWFALLLIQLLAMKLGILPVQGVDSWKGYVIPWICGTIGTQASFTRMARSSMLEVIRQDYITTARAKGQTEKKIIWHHAARNAMLPIVTALGGMMAGSIGYGVLTETIFSIPGVGFYLLTGINNRDYPVVRGCVLTFALIFSVMSLITDLLYGVVDPRMKSMYVTRHKKKKKNAEPINAENAKEET